MSVPEPHDEAIIKSFAKGWDTYTIASALRLPEHVVANRLAKLRDGKKANELFAARLAAVTISVRKGEAA